MNNKIDNAFELINIFYESGYEAYLVGGSVRDMIMSKSVEYIKDIKDIDITTNASPLQIEEVAKINNLKYIETGIQHGTITMIYNDIPMEVTTFRVDKNCNGRWCEVEFVRSLKEDLARRDFTINAIALDREGKPIDLFNGIMDIQNKVIRAVGNPERRFEEDKLRALRAIRFATVFGFDVFYNTYEALKSVSLHGISNERIRDELVKILMSKYRVKGIEMLANTGLFVQILPEVVQLSGIEQDEFHHPEKDVYIHTMMALDSLSGCDDYTGCERSLELVLAILLHDIGKSYVRSVDNKNGMIHFYEHEDIGSEMAEKILYRLKFPLECIKKVKWLVANHMKIHHFSEMKKSKKVKLIENEYFSDLLELMIADINGSCGLNESCGDFTIIDEIYEFIKKYEEEKKKRPILKQKLIDGYDVMNLGIKAGVVVGEVLEKVNDVIIEGTVNNREEALEYVKKLIKVNNRYGVLD